MKAFCFFLLSVTWVAVMPGTIYAAPTDEPKHQQTKNESARPASHNRALDKNHPHATLGLAKTSQPPLASRNSNRTKSQSLVRTPSAPASTVSRLPTMPPINVPHHGPNPARVGGATIPNARNSGTVNGTSAKAKR